MVRKRIRTRKTSNLESYAGVWAINWKGCKMFIIDKKAVKKLRLLLD